MTDDQLASVSEFLSEERLLGATEEVLAADRALATSPPRPCPFCGRPASVDAVFPASRTPWFVTVNHSPGCEIRCADGYRMTHRTREDALRSWNRGGHTGDWGNAPSDR